MLNKDNTIKLSLFVSYRRTQLARVEPAVRALEDAGIDCFFDQEAIDPLADFPKRIRQGIGTSHALLAWWSKDYAESDHCMAEFKLAWQHARRQSSDVGRRVWVLNPEAGGGHIAAGELNSQNFLAPPAPEAMQSWAQQLRARLLPLLPEGPLASERQAEAVPQLCNVPQPTATFTGRNAELMRIHSKLHPARIGTAGAAVAVQTHGLGGIGKTELAAKYAHDFAHAYPGGIYWLNFAGFEPGEAVSEQTAHNAWLLALEQTFSGERALLLDAEGKPLPAPELRVRLKGQLGTEPYLWVLDNVPELSPLDQRAAVLAFWRAPGAAGRTLITTRDSRPAEGFAEERLEVLNEEDALRLLACFRQPGKDDLEAARALVEEVGAHTLALTLIGEQLREALGGYAGALAALRAAGRLERIEVLAQELRPLLGAKARGILATFKVSMAALDQDTQRLLASAAVCAPNEPIPVSLLAARFKEDAFSRALSRLLRASLLTRRHGREQTGEPVEIHPLVADAALRLLAVPEGELAEALGNDLLTLVKTANNILTHDQALADAVRQTRHFALSLQSHTGVALGVDLGRYYYTCGLYPLARNAEEQALALALRVLGERHPHTLTSMNNLAQTLHSLGDLAGARALHEQVLAARREVLGERHPHTLTSMNDLATTLHALGDLAGARALHEQELAACREVLGERHPDTLTSMNNLAALLRFQGDLAGARALHEQVLAARREVLGERHPQTLRSMNNLAWTLLFQDDLAGARALYEQVLPARREVLGERHPQTLMSMNNLAETLHSLGDLAGARALHEQALAAHREVLGERHPDTLSSMHNLATTLDDLGDLAGARTLLEQVLAARREVLGERHPNTTGSAWCLFCTLKYLGAAEEAEQVRDGYLAWLHAAEVASLSGQQRYIRECLQSPALHDPRRSWLSCVVGWLRRLGRRQAIAQ